jgi:hypothetical protein
MAAASESHRSARKHLAMKWPGGSVGQHAWVARCGGIVGSARSEKHAASKCGYVALNVKIAARRGGLLSPVKVLERLSEVAKA